ncbi:MAG: hypothetical protein POELPBGB_01242 [Bacteroidia bacterium]|nr:hypothetical protein [Bacteroidia bacterium]
MAKKKTAKEAQTFFTAMAKAMVKGNPKPKSKKKPSKKKA